MQSTTDAELIALAQSGSIEARNALIERHSGLIWKFVRQACRVMSKEPDEHFGAGVEGFVRAVKGFNPALGFKFSTYAVRAILQETIASVRNDRLVRLPRHIFERKDFEAMNKAPKPSQMTDGVARCHGKSDRGIARAERLEALSKAMSVLSERSCDIVRRRLNNENLSDIGASMGLSKERVRQIEEDAIERMRNALRTEAA